MRNLLVAIIRILLFGLVWALLTYVANRALAYIPGLASLEGAQAALCSQLCLLAAAAVASLLFGFIDSDAHANGALSLGGPRIGWSVGYVLIAAVLPATVLLVSGAGHVEAAGIVSNRGIITGLGMGLQLGVGESPVLALAQPELASIPVWALYLLAVAATNVLVSFGYVFSVVQARAGDAIAVIVSLVTYLLINATCIPASALGAALVLAVGLMLALIALESGGMLAPLITSALYLLVARMAFGVVLVPAAVPSLAPLAAGEVGSLFGLLTIYPNISLVFLVCTCFALALAAWRAWRTRP